MSEDLSGPGSNPQSRPSSAEHLAQTLGPKYKVELTIDGERLPLKSFLHDVIGGSVAGMIEGLRDGPSAQVIEVRVTRRQTANSSSHESSN